MVIIVKLYFYRVTTVVKTTFIASPQGGFIAPHVRETEVRKNLTIFEGCHHSRFYMMISSSFRKIETKNSNSDPFILHFLVLGTPSPAAYWLCKHQKWS